MAERLIILSDESSKAAKYRNLIAQIDALSAGETDLIAILANITASLKQTFGFFWVGFYLVKDEMLVLGPFQGPIACTRIAPGKGVCGTAWKGRKTIIVPDVELFPGHIACNSESKSEIVIPVFSEDTITGVLDIDSNRINDFDETDAVFLEEIVSKINNQKSSIEKRKLSMDELNRKTVSEFKQSGKLPLTVVLDNVRSLHNIGSIFRTCDAFLIEALYLCGISATPPHKEIHKTALGAEDSVDWKYFETALQAVQHLQANGYSVWGVEQTENSVSLEQFQIKTGKPYALVFGNEVNGINQDVLNICEKTLEIPQFGTKHSFNVSVSAGIALWECYKQLKKSLFFCRLKNSI